MKSKIRFISIILLINLLFLSCAHRPPNINMVIKTADEWWRSIKTENPNYYQVIDLGQIVFHLCGSRAKLWVEFNELYPESPFDLSNNTYMFTIHYPRFSLTHVWLVVKVKNNKVILHKWAIGHESIRILSLYDKSLLNADKY